jgi:hypothetical protein
MYTITKRLAIFSSPAEMSLPKLSLARNNKIIPRQGEFGKSRLGTGKLLTFFYSVLYCTVIGKVAISSEVTIRARSYSRG